MKRAMAFLIALTWFLAGCGGGDSSGSAEAPPSALQAAYSACTKYTGPVQKAINKAPFTVNGRPIAETFLKLKRGSVLVTTPQPQGDKMSALAFVAARCILDQTDAPPSIQQAMSSSTALSGRQSDTYSNIKVGWSFNGSDPSSFEASFDPVG